MGCITLADALRAFGVAVEGGAHPQPCHVAAAYKRAVLAFHPDRQQRRSGDEHDAGALYAAALAAETFKLLAALRQRDGA